MQASLEMQFIKLHWALKSSALEASRRLFHLKIRSAVYAQRKVEQRNSQLHKNKVFSFVWTLWPQSCTRTLLGWTGTRPVHRRVDLVGLSLVRLLHEIFFFGGEHLVSHSRHRAVSSVRVPDPELVRLTPTDSTRANALTPRWVLTPAFVTRIQNLFLDPFIITSSAKDTLKQRSVSSFNKRDGNSTERRTLEESSSLLLIYSVRIRRG